MKPRDIETHVVSLLRQQRVAEFQQYIRGIIDVWQRNNAELLLRLKKKSRKMPDTEEQEILEAIQGRLIEVDLDGENFRHLSLPQVSFYTEKTDGVKFTLRGASFYGAHLIDAHFSECEMDETNFSCAHLARAVFNRSKLTGADFTHADLLDTVFGFAQLESADFTGALLHETNFSYADLSQTSGLLSISHVSSFASCILAHAINLTPEVQEAYLEAVRQSWTCK